MTDVKYFPGPWAIDDDTCSEEGDLAICVEGAHIVTIMGPGHFPCLVDGEAREDDEAKVEATAHLVAAAPDLLAACEVMLGNREDLRECPGCRADTNLVTCQPSCPLRLARAAIAKARGTS